MRNYDAGHSHVMLVALSALLVACGDDPVKGPDLTDDAVPASLSISGLPDELLLGQTLQGTIVQVVDRTGSPLMKQADALVEWFGEGGNLLFTRSYAIRKGMFSLVETVRWDEGSLRVRIEALGLTVEKVLPVAIPSSVELAFSRRLISMTEPCTSSIPEWSARVNGVDVETSPTFVSGAEILEVRNNDSLMCHSAGEAILYAVALGTVDSIAVSISSSSSFITLSPGGSPMTINRGGVISTMLSLQSPSAPVGGLLIELTHPPGSDVVVSSTALSQVCTARTWVESGITRVLLARGSSQSPLGCGIAVELPVDAQLGPASLLAVVVEAADLSGVRLPIGVATAVLPFEIVN